MRAVQQRLGTGGSFARSTHRPVGNCLIHAPKALIVAAKLQNIVAEDVCDAGRTEVEPGTRTVAAFGPAPCSAIDSITGKLRLLK